MNTTNDRCHAISRLVCGRLRADLLFSLIVAVHLGRTPELRKYSKLFELYEWPYSVSKPKSNTGYSLRDSKILNIRTSLVLKNTACDKKKR